MPADDAYLSAPRPHPAASGGFAHSARELKRDSTAHYQQRATCCLPSACEPSMTSSVFAFSRADTLPERRPASLNPLRYGRRSEFVGSVTPVFRAHKGENFPVQRSIEIGNDARLQVVDRSDDLQLCVVRHPIDRLCGSRRAGTCRRRSRRQRRDQQATVVAPICLATVR